MLKPLGVVLAALSLGSCDYPLFSGDNSRDVVVTATETSPDSQHVATVYMMSGGGAAGWCYQHVGVRRVDQPFKPDSGVVFSTRCSPIDVSAAWRSAGELRITYTPGAEALTRQDTALDGVIQVSYGYR